MVFPGEQTFQKLGRLLVAPTLEPSQRAARIQAVERDVILPLRVLIIAILGYYFFLRNYLFPREVEISLGDKAIFHEGWFSGTPCDSPAELQTNGFDLLLRYGPNGFALVPLTQKGVPR